MVGAGSIFFYDLGCLIVRIVCGFQKLPSGFNIPPFRTEKKEVLAESVFTSLLAKSFNWRIWGLG